MAGWHLWLATGLFRAFVFQCGFSSVVGELSEAFETSGDAVDMVQTMLANSGGRGSSSPSRKKMSSEWSAARKAMPKEAHRRRTPDISEDTGDAATPRRRSQADEYVYDDTVEDGYYRPLKWTGALPTPFEIEDCSDITNDEGAGLPKGLISMFEKENKRSCMQVFGVLIVSGPTGDPNLMAYAANIIANILDVDCDGKVDDEKLITYLSKFVNDNAPFMTVGGNSIEENCADDTHFASQAWKTHDNGRKPQIILEEAFHMIHQTGWAWTHPEQFGYAKWGADEQSIGCKCMREAQCEWYQHPENYGCTNISGAPCRNLQLFYRKAKETGQWNEDEIDLPGEDNIPGTCSKGDCSVPSCDCMEFIHKVYTTWLGNRFVGYERMQYIFASTELYDNNQRSAVEYLMGQGKHCQQLLEVFQDKSRASFPSRSIHEAYTCLDKASLLEKDAHILTAPD